MIMEMLIVALLAAALTAVVTWMLSIRRARSEQARLERQLDELKERMQRAGVTLASANVHAFEIPVGLKRAQPALEGAADVLAPVDFLGNPEEFLRRVHPHDASRLEGELKTLALQDGVRHFEYRFGDSEGREQEIRVVTRLVRDALGRPTSVSGVLMTGATTALSVGHAAPYRDEHEDVVVADESMHSDWEPFTPDYTDSGVLEGELIEIHPPRVQVAR